MSRGKKILLGFLLTMSLAVVAVVAWAWWRHAFEQRAEASYDPMMLPSRSRQLLPLADTLNRPERLALFRRYDIARLWLLGSEDPVQNGFVGPHHQRLEVVFQQARQDQQTPGLFHVRALMRLRHRITPLQGQIQLRQVRQHGQRNKQNPQLQVYTAVGSFTFWSRQSKQRLLQGTAAIDFDTSDKQECSLYADNLSMKHNTRCFAFEGYYYHNQQRQSALWAADFARLAAEVLSDFNVGGRHVTVNPKYARYGWNEYYQNDEWWAEKSVATRSRPAAQPEKL
ncbi:hypothetical protein [Hymenobacter elongatus]|uniref:Uncharacterized protein n=1 Tax=Hymenobacter elongatus TaxID=877208 RepID=A0A4Z0PKJ4_9BACT|nr:hypothetical protein [Hymenobacter elongatus]TGE16444.1 hypothetical protein E5J99_09975 [Hymenobacter elongatus]